MRVETAYERKLWHRDAMGQKRKGKMRVHLPPVQLLGALAQMRTTTYRKDSSGWWRYDEHDGRYGQQPGRRTHHLKAAGKPPERWPGWDDEDVSCSF